MPSFTHALWRTTADVLFPRRCAACQVGLPEGVPRDYCQECWRELALLTGPACPRCGAPRPLEGVGGPRCPRCEKHTMRFDAAIAAGAYEGLLRLQVLAAKHPSGESAAVALGRLTADAAKSRLADERVDVVTCIPMHWRRRLVRQHNSAETLGHVLAERLGAPLAPRLLRRTRSTRRQSELSMTDRSRNVRGALSVRSGHRFQDATIVLADDILTTGATCSDAARALKQAGAARVVAVVAARSL